MNEVTETKRESVEDIVVKVIAIEELENSKGCTVCGVDGKGY